MPGVSLSLLVLKTRQLDELRKFYSLIGIQFGEEQHGTGPVHFAGEVASTVLELYPLADDARPDSSTRLGFSVSNLDHVLKELTENDFCSHPKTRRTEWGYHAVVKDPDGRSVELCQR
ncbi:MAG: hypothetical protein KDA65_17290 [Planctomycetaceae bacterium]|nr:hypothetical protein [Planctomycetaceae bacterium]